MGIGESGRKSVVKYDENESARRLKLALSALGRLEDASDATRSMIGTMKYGLQKVRLRITYEANSNGTRICILGASDDIWGVASRNSSDRLLGALDRVDDPTWKPDKLGMSKSKLVMFVGSFVVFIGGVVIWLTF